MAILEHFIRWGWILELHHSIIPSVHRYRAMRILSNLLDTLIVLIVVFVTIIYRVVVVVIDLLNLLVKLLPQNNSSSSKSSSNPFDSSNNLDINYFNTYYKDKVVLVTGSTSGIGEALVQELASKCSCKAIILCGRNTEKLNQIIKELNERNSLTEYISWDVDISDYEHIEDKYRRLKASLGDKSIDILINNAGVSSRGGALDCSMESLQKVFNTNFFGTVAVTKVVVSDMIAAKRGGNVTVVTSVQGKIGLPYRTAYSSSKHALQGYFDGIRGELLPHKIYTTIISPGYVRTQLSMNAVNADGSNYGRTDENTAKGMDPSELAKEILISIANKQIDVIVADPMAKAAVFVKNLIPELLAKMTQNRK